MCFDTRKFTVGRHNCKEQIHASQLGRSGLVWMQRLGIQGRHFAATPINKLMWAAGRMAIDRIVGHGGRDGHAGEGGERSEREKKDRGCDASSPR